jgi:hypothetical protein
VFSRLIGNTTGVRVARIRTALIGLALCLAVAGSALSATDKPSLRVRTFNPLSVRGTHFHPGERVKVTVGGGGVRRTTGSPLVVRPLATSDGTFVALFRGVSVNRCDGYLVQAKGSMGSVAVLRAKPLECASTNPG